MLHSPFGLEWEDMIIPCLVKGSNHKILEVAVSKLTEYKLQRQRSDGAVLVRIQRWRSVIEVLFIWIRVLVKIGRWARDG